MQKLQLSAGSIHAIWNGQTPLNPVVQIIDCRKVANQNAATPNSADRYRLIISDSINYQQAMLATQLNELVMSNAISTRCVIRLNEYLCNVVHGRKIIILLSVEPLSQPLPGSIGNPVSIDHQPSGSPSCTPPQSNNLPNSASVQTNAPRPSIPSSGVSPQRQPNYANQVPNSPMQTNQPPQSVASPNRMYQHPASPQKPQPQAVRPLPGQPWKPSSNPMPPQMNASPQPYPNTPATPAIPDHINPISSLSPAKQRWTIKARVTAKSGIKTWNNDRGGGKLASIDLLDSFGGEIRATMFQETVDTLYELFQVNKGYLISKGAIKQANKKFSSHEWEITFNNETVVIPLQEEEVPRVTYKFISIQAVEQQQKGDTIDVLGVVFETAAPITIMSKGSGKDITRRTIKITDKTHSIEVTLWGDQAENPGWQEFDHPVLAIKGATVSDFHGRSLSCMRSCMVAVNPDLPEAQQLRQWYESQGGRLNSTPMSVNSKSDDQPAPMKTVAQIKDEQLGMSETPDTFTVKATLTMMKRESGTTVPWYPACSTPSCGGKKVTSEPLSQTYHCAKCNESTTTPELRYLLSFAAADHTGSTWMSAFNEVGATLLLGKKAAEMAWLKDAHPGVYDTTWQDAVYCQYNLKIKAIADNYQGETRARLSVVGVRKLDYVAESRTLIDAINQFSMDAY